MLKKLSDIAPLELWRDSFYADKETGLLYKLPAMQLTGYLPKDRRPIINCFSGHVVRVHKVNWFLWTGNEPAILDHINGNQEDNSFKNLRECTKSQNNFNVTKRLDNTSGYKGVFAVYNAYSKGNPRWGARVTAYGTNYNLGIYATPEEANEACIIKRAELHKEFANNGTPLTKEEKLAYIKTMKEATNESL
jgi:hypothetical protein